MRYLRTDRRLGRHTLTEVGRGGGRKRYQDRVALVLYKRRNRRNRVSTFRRSYRKRFTGCNPEDEPGGVPSQGRERTT